MVSLWFEVSVRVQPTSMRVRSMGFKRKYGWDNGEAGDNR